MKMLVEYVDTAIKFETMAAAETDAKLKTKLAEKRAKEYGLKPPPDLAAQ
jgi:hypothetical protein